MPSIPEARARLLQALQSARAARVPVLKIIHGYGSTGVGGDLRFALQATLRQMENAGEIKACIFGENWSKGDERAWNLLKRVPSLKADSDLGRKNRGMTIVVL